MGTMKFGRRFKILFFVIAIAMYASGAGQFVAARWFPVERGFGPEPSGLAIALLRAHSSVSFLFLIVFGYLLHSHVRPGLRSKKKFKSGLSVLIPIGLLTATVPGLLYLSDERLKPLNVFVHVAVGFAVGGVFLIHLVTRPKTRI